MTPLTLAQMRALLRLTSQSELEDMLCMLYLTSKEASSFFNRRYNTQEYFLRFSDTYRAKLRICFSYSNSCGMMHRVKQYLTEYERVVSDPAMRLEMIMYCMEEGVKLTCDGELPISACDEMTSLFKSFVETINALHDEALFRCFQKRIEALEWNAGAVGEHFGEEISDLCLEIEWWGKE